ncbi:MAG: hypothetical protein QRY72_03575 [Candidatus Rhabdochlamydia sp.]
MELSPIKSEIRKEIHAFKDAILETLEDPVTTALLTQAVTLFPCGHSVREEDLKTSCRSLSLKTKVLSAPSHTVRNLAEIIHTYEEKTTNLHAKQPSFSSQMTHPFTPLEALKQIQPQYAASYYKLSRCVPKGKLITLPSGKKMRQQQLLLEAIWFEPHYAELYYQLGTLVSTGEIAELPSGEKANQMELFLRAIQLNPSYAKTYHALAQALPAKAVITLPTGEKKTRLELYLKALEINSKYESIDVLFAAFSPFIYKKEPLHLSNGKLLSFKEFTTKIVCLYEQTSEQLAHLSLLNHNQK